MAVGDILEIISSCSKVKFIKWSSSGYLKHLLCLRIPTEILLENSFFFNILTSCFDVFSFSYLLRLTTFLAWRSLWLQLGAKCI